MRICGACGNVAWEDSQRCLHQELGVTRHRSDRTAFLVQSRRDPNITYTVKIFGLSTSCTCKHGQNNQGIARCYHVDLAETFEIREQEGWL